MYHLDYINYRRFLLQLGGLLFLKMIYFFFRRDLYFGHEVSTFAATVMAHRNIHTITAKRQKLKMRKQKKKENI